MSWWDRLGFGGDEMDQEAKERLNAAGKRADAARRAGQPTAAWAIEESALHNEAVREHNERAAAYTRRYLEREAALEEVRRKERIALQDARGERIPEELKLFTTCDGCPSARGWISGNPALREAPHLCPHCEGTGQELTQFGRHLLRFLQWLDADRPRVISDVELAAKVSIFEEQLERQAEDSRLFKAAEAGAAEAQEQAQAAVSQAQSAAFEAERKRIEVERKVRLEAEAARLRTMNLGERDLYLSALPEGRRKDLEPLLREEPAKKQKS